MKNKFDLDFKVLCRLCLHKAPELHPIFDCDLNFSNRIESCVGLEIRQCDPGPTHMCVDCISHIENWEEFKQKCKTSNECIQEYLKELDSKKLNLTVDKLVKLEDLETDEQDDNYDSTFNNDLIKQDSDNDSIKSKSPISITVREVYPRAAKQDGKVFEITNTKTSNKKKRYECGMCSFTCFSEKESLYSHLVDFHNSEENNTPHYCLICNKGYCSFKVYQDHLSAEQDVHGSNQMQLQDKIKDLAIGCGLCNCKFSRSTSLYRHLRNHALKKDLMPHMCSFCQVGFLDTYSLYQHASTEHQIAPIKERGVAAGEKIMPAGVKHSPTSEATADGSESAAVDEGGAVASGAATTTTEDGPKDACGYAITTKRKVKQLKTVEDKRAKYREHYRRFQSKTYACEFCDVTYSRFCDLSAHDRVAHDDMAKEFSCPTCGKLFLTAGRLDVHRNAFHAEKAFGCDVCHVRCKSKHTLRTHMRKHSGVFACGQCGLTTASNAALVSHVRVHTGEKPYVCDMCGNSYASKLGLTSHERTHQQEALFKCNVCGYTGSSHSSIYIHRQTHNADKPYVCDVCGKTFKIKVRLVDHQKIHFATKDHVCEVCDKAFLARYQLVQHSRTHSGEKPFQCHLCAKSFARRDGLSEHIRTHTGEKRYTCAGCFRTFSFYKSMKNHKCAAAAQEAGDKDKAAAPAAAPPLPAPAEQPTPPSDAPRTDPLPPSAYDPPPAAISGGGASLDERVPAPNGFPPSSAWPPG